LVGEWSRESAICDLILQREKVNNDDLFDLKLRGRRSFDPLLSLPLLLLYSTEMPLDELEVKWALHCLIQTIITLG